MLRSCDCFGVQEVHVVQRRHHLAPFHGVRDFDGQTVITTFEMTPGTCDDLLEELWEAFTERHPNHEQRFLKRYPRMKEFGAVLLHRYETVGPRKWVSTSKKRKGARKR